MAIGSGRFRYETEEGWGKVPEGYDFPDAPGVTVDSKDNVYVLNRGPHPVIVFDRPLGGGLQPDHHTGGIAAALCRLALGGFERGASAHHRRRQARGENEAKKGSRSPGPRDYCGARLPVNSWCEPVTLRAPQ